MSAIARAYASNEATPISTFEFSHSAISTMYFVQGYYDVEATTESGKAVTFLKSGLGFSLPERSTEGVQELQIQIDNLSNETYEKLRTIQLSMRQNDERAKIKYRPYLEADLSAPSGAVFTLSMTSASITRNQATILANWAPFPDSSYPRKRYYPTLYAGVKYADG